MPSAMGVVPGDVTDTIACIVMRALFRVIVHVLTVLLLVKIIKRYTGDRIGILATH